MSTIPATAPKSLLTQAKALPKPLWYALGAVLALLALFVVIATISGNAARAATHGQLSTADATVGTASGPQSAYDPYGKYDVFISLNGDSKTLRDFTLRKQFGQFCADSATYAMRRCLTYDELGALIFPNAIPTKLNGN